MDLLESFIRLLLVSMMATSDISKAVEEDGKVVKVDINPICRSGTAFSSWSGVLILSIWDFGCLQVYYPAEGVAANIEVGSVVLMVSLDYFSSSLSYFISFSFPLSSPSVCSFM